MGREGVCAMGPVAAETVPALIEVLEDPRRSHFDRLTTIEVLARIGGTHADAIPALIRTAQVDPDSDRETAELREAAVESLSLVGAPAAPAVPMLLRVTQESEGRLRKKAVASLQAIGPAAGIAAQTLAELLVFDELIEVREAAAVALAKIGPDGEATLVHLLGDRDAGVRSQTAVALGRVPAASENVIAARKRLCRTPRPQLGSRRRSRCGD